MSNLQKFSDIEQFRNVLRNVQHKAQFTGLDAAGEPIMNRLAIAPTIRYESTVKIHGSNMSIRIEGDKVTAQSRNNEISPENDCYGFAKFIVSLPVDVINTFKALFGDNIVVFGEWAGKGVQDTVAVSQLDRFWTVFRVQTITDDPEKSVWVSLDGKDLTILNQYRIFSIRQFGVETLDINFESSAESVNKLNEISLKVEEECPVAKFFGVSGIGEGRVWCPVVEETAYQSSKFVFKIKGQAHSKSKVKKLANVDVEKMANIEAFVDKHLSEERLVQGWNWLRENGKPQTEVSTGDFIKWLFNDIIKEESDELTASGLAVKDLGGMVAKKAKIWFFQKLNKEVGL